MTVRIYSAVKRLWNFFFLFFFCPKSSSESINFCHFKYIDPALTCFLQRSEQALMLAKTDPHYCLTLVLCVTCQLACVMVMLWKLTLFPRSGAPLLNKPVIFPGTLLLGVIQGFSRCKQIQVLLPSVVFFHSSFLMILWSFFRAHTSASEKKGTEIIITD